MAASEISKYFSKKGVKATAHPGFSIMTLSPSAIVRENEDERVLALLQCTDSPPAPKFADFKLDNSTADTCTISLSASVLKKVQRQYNWKLAFVLLQVLAMVLVFFLFKGAIKACLF